MSVLSIAPRHWFIACALTTLTLMGCSSDGSDAQTLPGDPAFVRDAALNVDNVSRHGGLRGL